MGQLHLTIKSLSARNILFQFQSLLLNISYIFHHYKMGRKSEKTLKKKAEKKQENNRVLAARAAVAAANKLDDPMKELIVFKKFDRNGLKLSISCCKADDLDPETKNFVFDITKANMKDMWDAKAAKDKENGYEKSDWGWDDKAKKDEMYDGMARYLIARTEDGTPVAMTHFRFDMECDDEVLYCYEIQMAEEFRRKGLGKFLMQVLELMAFKTSMMKVMLTCFKDNKPAQDFFRGLKYTVDETSPQESLAETIYDDYHYQILSKMIKRKTSQPSAASSGGGDAHCNGHCC